MRITRIIMSAAALAIAAGAYGQERLSLEECRRMAVSNNKALEQARISTGMAHYDRDIARANYFPNISASGTYLYNTLDVSLIDSDKSASLRNAGTAVQGSLSAKMEELTRTIMGNPALAMEYMQSPMWQTVLGALSQTDISQAINGIGSSVDDLLHPDLHNIVLAGVSLQQPVFAGGKIIAADRIARLAEELAESKYNAEYAQTIVNVDQAYWQIVSIAAKKELAGNYSDLLKTMEHDVELSADEGVATQSDVLTIKVKANEAEMMLTKVTNGLKLSKMLLCRQIGLPLDSDLLLADEGCNDIALPQARTALSMEEITARRPELRSLGLASQIFDEKVKVARADMMPQLALTGNFFLTNPSMTNGFQKDFHGFFTAGVALKVPIFHGLEALKKTQKAKLEAELYKSKYDDGVNMVNLEISQLYSQRSEAMERLQMANSNLSSAEENLRAATIGFEEGVVESNVALAAQSAWLQAHTECIDAEIELLMTDANLNRAEGQYTSDK
ncbi:MAG: TolC family protein [Bacteroidales bacterium]|nr:TolC family protein [Candidatus Cryptobacteroides choladohippi]